MLERVKYGKDPRGTIVDFSQVVPNVPAKNPPHDLTLACGTDTAVSGRVAARFYLDGGMVEYTEFSGRTNAALGTQDDSPVWIHRNKVTFMGMVNSLIMTNAAILCAVCILGFGLSVANVSSAIVIPVVLVGILCAVVFSFMRAVAVLRSPATQQVQQEWGRTTYDVWVSTMSLAEWSWSSGNDPQDVVRDIDRACGFR